MEKNRYRRHAVAWRLLPLTRRTGSKCSRFLPTLATRAARAWRNSSPPLSSTQRAIQRQFVLKCSAMPSHPISRYRSRKSRGQGRCGLIRPGRDWR